MSDTADLQRPRVAALAQPAQPAREQQRQSSSFSFKYLLLGFGIFAASRPVLNYVTRGTQHGIQVPDPSSPGSFITVPTNIGNISPFPLRPFWSRLSPGYFPTQAAPIWPDDSTLDVVVTVASTPHTGTGFDEEKVVAREEGFRMSDWSDRRVISTEVAVPAAVQRNGTLWARFYVGLHGAELNPRLQRWDSAKAYASAFPLTQYMAKKKDVKSRKLLGVEADEAGKTGESGEKEHGDEVDRDTGPVVLSYYHPNVSIAFVPDMGVLSYGTLHQGASRFVHLEATGARDGMDDNGWYYPVLFVNTFFQLRAHMYPINTTTPTVPLHIDLSNMAAWKFYVMSGAEMSVRENVQQAALDNPSLTGTDGSEFEVVKELLLDTNPILLAVTAVVTVAHPVLEMLAFGSDIAHFRNKRDNIGISVRTILANVVMQAIVLLYLLDNARSTSWMILGSQAVGIVVEIWKITTVVNVKVRARGRNEEGGLFGGALPWTVTFEDKHRLSETEARTKKYDEIAFRYMYMLAAPLLVAYAAYSLVYETHKSWYSFVITTLVGSVYAYGFLMMVPALYINYRLQSVAHMAGRAMMYKFLNTFIDDLFAFATKMPILHRLATFRDDVIFFVYLYQRWRYRVDHTRMNEFGQGGNEEETAGGGEVEGGGEAGGEGGDEQQGQQGQQGQQPEAAASGAKAKRDGEGRKRKTVGVGQQ